MSSRQELPDAISLAAEKVRAATRGLVAAARAGEAEAIDRAIADRGQAVDALRQTFERCAVAPDAEARRQLVESLALQAHDAETELAQLQGRVRNGLAAVIGGGKASRGYVGNDEDSRSLDRSG